MAEKTSKEIFYVSANNSHDLRRLILETSKQVIEGLHNFEKYKAKRAEKIKAMEELIILFRQINELSAQMKIDMPKIKLPEYVKKKPAKIEKKAAEPTKEFKHESEDELQKLEAAIAQIEGRLEEIK